MIVDWVRACVYAFTHLAQASPLAQGGPVAETFIQFGAIGTIALLALGGLKTLDARQAKTLELERARADRAEQQVRELERSVREQTVPALLQSATTMAEVIKLLEKRAQQ